MDNRLNLVISFAQKGLKELSGGLKNLVGLGKSGSDALRDMGRESGRLKRELASVRRELGDTSGNVTDLINRERELEDAIAGVNRQMQRQSALNTIDAKADAMRQRGELLRQRGRENVIGGAAMLAPLLLAGKSAAEFSSGMVDIQQKAELSDEATARLRNNILAAARASKQLPEDMRAAVDTLAGLGLSPEEAVRAASPMGRFMTAFKVQGTDAAASVYAGFQNLNIPLEQSARLLDMMAAGGNQGAFEARDMAAALPNLTAQLKALGQTGEGAAAELIAALEIVRRGTGTSGEAATSVNDLLSKLTAPSTISSFGKKNIDVLAEIKRGAERGISPLETMIALTRRATGGDPMKLGQFFTEKDSRTAIRQLMLDYDDFQKMKREIGSAEGLTDRAFDQRVANDQTVQLRELGGAMANLALSVAPVVLPFLKQASIYLSKTATAVANWAEEHPRAAGMLLKLFAAVAIGKVALGGLQLAFGGLLGPLSTAYRYFKKVDGISRFGTHLSKAKGVVKAAAPVFMKGLGLIRTAAMFMAKGVAKAGMLLMTNPMVLGISAIVLAVGVAGYLIWKHWDAIKAGFDSGVAMLGRARDWVKGKLLGFPALFGPLGMVAGLVIRNWDSIKAGFQSGWANVKAFFGDIPGSMKVIGKAIITGLLTFITPGALTNRLLSIARSGVKAFKDYFGIKSPSRLFMEMGGYLTGGLADGIDRGARGPIVRIDRLGKSLTAVWAASAPTLALAAATPSALPPRGPLADLKLGRDFELPQRRDLELVPLERLISLVRPKDERARSPEIQRVPTPLVPAHRAPGRANYPNSGAPRKNEQPITINITINQQPGEDGDALARRAVELMERNLRSARRGAYYDE